MARIKIVCAESWGRRGNLNSAKVIAASLRDLSWVDDVDVLPFEDIWPKFGEWGAEMLHASEGFDPQIVSEKFHRIFKMIDQELAAGTTVPLRDLTAALRNSHAVIGTKGIISRFLVQARCASQSDVRIINWVTNFGLLKFPMHMCANVDGHFVPFQHDAEWIHRFWRIPRNKIHAIGPPISLAELTNNDIVSRKSEKPLIVAYFNFLGPQCCATVKKILELSEDSNVTVLYAVAEPEAEKDLKILQSKVPNRLVFSERASTIGFYPGVEAMCLQHQEN